MIYSVVTLELTPQREGNLILFWRWFSLPFFHFRTWSSTPPVFSAEAAVFILSVLDAIVLHTQHFSSTKLTENQNPASVNMRNKTQRRCTHATWMNTEYGQLHPVPSSLTLHYLTPLGKILLQGCDLTIIYKMTQAKSTLERTQYQEDTQRMLASSSLSSGSILNCYHPHLITSSSLLWCFWCRVYHPTNFVIFSRSVCFWFADWLLDSIFLPFSMFKPSGRQLALCNRVPCG